MERHYCYSCRDRHAFLEASEWAQVEPLWREGQRTAARAARIAHRLQRPIPEAAWLDFFGPALKKYTEITGERLANPHSLFHRQLVHACKWQPRPHAPPPDPPSSVGGAA